MTSTLTIEVVDIDAEIAEQGAKIRGQYKNFKAMDALQIAAAVSKKETSSFTRFPFLLRKMGLEGLLLVKNIDRKGISDTSSDKCNQSVTKSSSFTLRMNRSNHNKKDSFVLFDFPI